MQLPDNATPEELIDYAVDLAGGEYGEPPVDIYYSKNTIFCSPKEVGEHSFLITKRRVCGYVVHILGIGLTDFPGCSEKDRHKPFIIRGKTIQEFKRRTAYLLSKDTPVTLERHDAVRAA